MAATERSPPARPEPDRPAQPRVAPSGRGDRLPLVTKRYPSGDMASTTPLRRLPGRVRLPRRPVRLRQVDDDALLIKESEPTAGEIRSPAATWRRSRAPRARTTAATSAWSSRTTSCCRTAPVYENVAYALQVTGGSRREIRDKVPDILRLTGLSTKLHNYPTSCPAASSSASRSRARSSTTRRC
jgi:cell division transport system ATP-binding protein